MDYQVKNMGLGITEQRIIPMVVPIEHSCNLGHDIQVMNQEQLCQIYRDFDSR